MNRTKILYYILYGFLVLLLVGCATEDGDLTPPDIGFDGTQSPTSATSVILTGTMSTDALVTADATLPAVAVITDRDNVNGTWECSVSGMSHGSNIVLVSVTDPIGNTRQLKITIIVDRVGPVVTLNQFVTPTPSGSQVLAGTVNEVGSKIQYSIGSGPWIFVDAVTGDVNGDVWYLDHDFGGFDDFLVEIRGCDQTPPLDADFCGNYSTAYASEVITVNALAPVLTVNSATPPATDFPWLAGIIPYFTPTPDLDVDSDVTFTGTFPSSGYNLTTTITSGTAETPIIAAGSWSAGFSGVSSGNSTATISINNNAGTDPADSKILIVRDLTPASVIATVPANGESVAAGTTNIIGVTFSESMDPVVDNINASNLSIVDSQGTIVTTLPVNSVDIKNREYEFSIDPLVSGETYTVTLLGDEFSPINDAAGNAFSSYSWKFKTDPIP